MARAAVLCCALALVLAVSAQDEKKQTPASFLADAILNKGTTVKTRTASGYYGYSEPEIASLTQANIKSCRYTDCAVNEAGCCGGPDSICPTNLAFQMDLTCAPKEQHYGNDRHDIGFVGLANTVGTCDWEISLFRWGWDGDSPVGDFEPTPMLTSEGVYKFGTAWGTCYLNADASSCDSPLCERMAISIQGGLYGTYAYSTTSATQSQALANMATALETCAGNPPNPGVGGRRPARKPAAGAKDGAQKIPEGEGGFNIWQWLVELIIAVLRYLLLGVSPSPPPSPPSRAAAPAPPTQKAQIAYEHEESVQVYPGIALIISGPFYEISHHDADIQQTGLFELPIYYESSSDVATAPTNNWPIVSVKNAKLRFNRNKKREEYYGQEGGRE